MEDTRFEDLNLSSPLLQAIEDLEFEKPTQIQIDAFAPIMSGRDLIGVAQTGTGKTIAYLMPLLREFKFNKGYHPRVLILVPTRELVVQVVEEIAKLTKYMSVRFDGVYGGANINTQKEKVEAGLDIIVATPGRLRDLVLNGALKLSSVKKMVIDEVDEMLNLGFRSQLNDIFDLLPEKRQNLMFSATMTEDVEKLLNTFFFNPVKIEVDSTGTPVPLIRQVGYDVPNYFTKINLLHYLLENDIEIAKSKILIFTDSRKLADRLLKNLDPKFLSVTGIIHSNRSQNNRFAALRRFETGENKILISTDLMARGIDIQDVTHVFNFDLPEVPETYIHRIGRTGRAEKSGIAIAFVNEKEKEYQINIETLMAQPIPMEEMPIEVEISDVFTDEEKVKKGNKSYLRPVKVVRGKAFHPKKEKNMKVNQPRRAKKK